MFILVNHFEIIFFLYWVNYTIAMGVLDRSLDFANSDSNSNLVHFLTSKSYIPNEIHMPKTSVIKSSDPDAHYLLSKLSDQDLLRLLNEQPKKNEYDLSDAIKLASSSKIAPEMPDSKVKKQQLLSIDDISNQNINNQEFQEASSKNNFEAPVFRLEYKPVKPFKFKEGVDSKYIAIQKLNNMLYSHPREQAPEDGDDDEKRELLFDVLVAQLKSLCCKKSKPDNTKYKLRSPHNEILGRNIQESWRDFSPPKMDVNNEHMFLVLNDEIKSASNEELISVDPNTLDQNSSVLLLGPITAHLTDSQLKLVMNRISNELSKPEYLPVLQQLSDGSIGNNNLKLVKSLITGPETRRYIKPHRCNHQSKLAKIYGGPKWIICTGYLNVNTPSLYDK